jgi:xanthine dehydrogenase YagR molybdenum-binding subunit
MPWPQNRRLLGTKVPRLDGPEKATGRARYTYDINRPGMLFGKILRCPHAHARIRSLDLSAARKTNGFRAVVMIAARPDTRPFAPLTGWAITNLGTELFHAGAEILAIAADTEEHCEDCLRAVQINFEQLPHQVKEDDALRTRMGTAGPPTPGANVAPPAVQAQPPNWKPDFDGLVTHEGTYGVPIISHQCLESHGIVCEWDDKLESLTIWSSVQAVPGAANNVAVAMGIPVARVKSITHYMGGGFGSKFGSEVENIACARLARLARAPVKLMLDRSEEVTVGGMRPSTYGRVKIGATKQGDIRAMEAVCYGSPGVATAVGAIVPYVYNVTNFRRSFEVVRLNVQKSRAMRAPTHPQSCVMTDQPVDDLAARLNMDPMQLRLRNLPANDQIAMKNAPTTFAAMRNTIWTREILIARQMSQWDKKWHPPGRGGDGPIKHGIGMALHTWGGAGNAGNDVRVTISGDGSVLVQSSTQDLGTGNRTVLAIVAAEILGLEPQDITVRIGESPFGASSGSGGSTTCPSVAPSALAAATAARDAFLTAVAMRMNVAANVLRIEPGVVVNTNNNMRTPWRQACAMLGMNPVSEMRRPAAGEVNTQGGVGGVQIAEVKVDTETGIVRCLNFYTVQDCGLIINKLCCESQVAGGIIMGINYALFEQCIYDSRTGRMCNADMEFYRLGGIRDMPNIHVHMLDMPERGVIGIGEPPTVSTAAAMGNAVFNAIGRRVTPAPFTPDRVLAALAAK